MNLREWNERYRSGQRQVEDLEAAPSPVLVNTAGHVRPGKALDLACGTGRNALWLAENGWSVTAVDGSEVAIDILRRRASDRGLQLDARVADLEKRGFFIEPSAWDLIALCYYLQLELLEPAKQGLVPGGLLLTIVHITEPGEPPTYKRLAPGTLPRYFQGWEILHNYEGQPHDSSHQRAVAEIVARRPAAPRSV
jgi:SAM-dependent methyltransferase